MRPIVSVSVALALAAPGVGCASPHPRLASGRSPVFDRPAAEAVALPPIAIGYEPEEEGRSAIAYGFPAHPTEGFDEHLVRALEESGGFGRVARLPAARDEAASLAAARGAGAPLLLTVRLDRLDVHFQEHNGMFVWNMLIWSMVWWPSWFIDDQTYRLDLVAEVALLRTDAPEGASPLLRERIALEARRDLDDCDRGFQILGIVRTPGCYEAEDWRHVSGYLVPVGLDQLVDRLLERLVAALGPG